MTLETVSNGPAAGADRVRRGTTHCRFCGAALETVVVDLGASPPSERFLAADQLEEAEPFYPLRALVCERCWLVQIGEYFPPDEIFSEYAYFSSYSTSWVEHARVYAARMTEQLCLGAASLVVELGSNDGYLLRHFVERGVPVLGIEPATNVAVAAIAVGVPTLVRFFGQEVAGELVAGGRRADLLIGNNVLAQVPDLHDFVAGIAHLLAPDGLLTMEFPHVLRLLRENQFDTIYHEHFSYFSLGTATRIFATHGLAIVDVEELPTHGGSLRIHVRHAPGGTPSAQMRAVIAEEQAAGLETSAPYLAFGDRVEATKRDLLAFLIKTRRAGRRIVGYGAPGKANTLLNYCGIRTDFVDFLVDRNPYKHGRFTPGTRIPILPPERLAEARPDYVWVMPWNLTREITEQMAGIREWGGRFIVAIPGVRVLDSPADRPTVEASR